MTAPLESEFSLTRAHLGLGEAEMEQRPTLSPPDERAHAKPAEASREVRRAAALRANLRRRKTGPQAPSAGDA